MNDPGKIIARAARNFLKPHGYCQKGRSRTWIQDHGFWTIVVEFQPDRSKGSYLNVGVCWLWVEKDYFSFDYGDRVPGVHFGFEGCGQFIPKAEALACRAVEESAMVAQKFLSLAAIADILSKEAVADWSYFHAAMACGLAGRRTDAERFFNAVLSRSASVRWQRQLHERAREMIGLLGDSAKFNLEVERTVDRCRSLLKLPAVQRAFTEI
jgi:hypothetical protein